jgi:hypothetical protein
MTIEKFEDSQRDDYKEKAKILEPIYARNFAFLHMYPIIQPGIIIFKDALENFDGKALIIGAGPSLDEDIEKIKEYENDVLLIAVDAAMNDLVKHEITPHIIVCCDPSERQINNFIGKDVSNSFIFLSTVVHPMTFDECRRSRGRICWFNYADMSSETCKNICLMTGKRKGALLPGVLTTGVAMQAAIWLGVKEIGFVGQDLCYYDLDRGYSKNIDEQKIEFQKRAKYKDLIEYNDLNGNIVLTHETFLAFHKWFNEVSKNMWSGINFYNCTGCGLLYGDNIKQEVLENFLFSERKKVKGNTAKKILENVWNFEKDLVEIVIGPVQTESIGDN